ncbi:MAG: M23 family peptidase, partial [Pontibacter sp.]|nr:M23 family peptidase [Pontibacter sp.]
SVYHIRLVAKDTYNNASTLSFVVKGQKPAFTQNLNSKVTKPQLSYEIIGNILKVYASDTSATPRNVEMVVNNQRLMLVPSYTKGAASVSLYDLRGGLPASLEFCGATTLLNLQAAVPSDQEYSFTNRDMTIRFDKESLYDTLYLQAKKEGDVYTIGDYFTPLHKAIKVTITPSTPVTDKSKAAVYYLGLGKGRGMLGGVWDGNSITFSTRSMGKFKVLEDTKAPTIKLLSKSPTQIRFRIGDDLSGINSFRCEVNGKWLLMKYEHKTATIYSEKLDKSIPLSGKVVLKVKDNAGNEAEFTTSI